MFGNQEDGEPRNETLPGGFAAREELIEQEQALN